MSSYEKVSDAETVSVPSGGTESTRRFDVGDADQASFVIEGDANASDITVDYKATEESNGSLAEVQRGIQTGNNWKRSNIDLTSYNNNKVILQNIPVGGLNELAAHLTDGASGGDVDVTVRVATRQIS